MSLLDPELLTLQDAIFLPPNPIKKKIESAFQDTFEVTYTKAHREYLTDAELVAIEPGSVFTFDGEFYVNYALFCFKHIASGKYLSFEWPFDTGKLRWVANRFLLVGFNSRMFDIPMLTLCTIGLDVKQLKEASNKIIMGGMMPYQIEQSYKCTLVKVNGIDLIEVCPLEGSLKLYAGRLHARRMQDLPIPPDAVLTQEQKCEIKDYCHNDIDNTELVFTFLKPQIDLRYTLSNVYNVDLRSKSDAQIAESVIAAELHRLTGKKPERVRNAQKAFFYKVPPFIQYQSPCLQNALEVIRTTPFNVKDTGGVALPDEIANLNLSLGDCIYRLGIGGLHSSEKTIVHKVTDETVLLDRDVASYYPSIILNQELYPRHLGKPFLEVYRTIVNRRLEAKKNKDKVTADSLKITINGSFGKLGNQYSILYSPELLIQVTVSGQLCLLLLIDMIESCRQHGMRVISANTDGIVIECVKTAKHYLEQIIAYWEKITSFVTEETEYSAVYSRDVNNYIALKPSGEHKVKGAYSEKGSSGDSPLSRNPEAFICNDAAIAFLKHGTPVEQTIQACKDIRRFVIVRNVRGGAVKSGKYLGKTIRWYFSNQMKGEINYVTSGNKVPNSDGARPLMELPTEKDWLPTDLDYNRYIEIAQSFLVEIGATPALSKLQGLLFENEIETTV